MVDDVRKPMTFSMTMARAKVYRFVIEAIDSGNSCVSHHDVSEGLSIKAGNAGRTLTDLEFCGLLQDFYTPEYSDMKQCVFRPVPATFYDTPEKQLNAESRYADLARLRFGLLDKAGYEWPPGKPKTFLEHRNWSRATSAEFPPAEADVGATQGEDADEKPDQARQPPGGSASRTPDEVSTALIVPELEQLRETVERTALWFQGLKDENERLSTEVSRLTEILSGIRHLTTAQS